MSKMRLDYVTNSSSSSFTIRKRNLTDVIKNKSNERVV